MNDTHKQSPTDARELVATFYRAFDEGRIDRFEAIDPGFEAKVFGDTTLDWNGFVEFGRGFQEAFPNGRHCFDHVVVEGDRVATIGRYRGRQERDFMGIAATGREVDFVVFHLDCVREGRLVEHRGIGDADALWSQLGLHIPTPARP